MTLELKRVYQKERRRLLAYIRKRIASSEDAEDILQDVFFSTMESMNVAEPIGNLVGWIYAVARNKIIDWYRKKKLRTVSLHEQTESHDASLGGVLSDFQFNPEQTFYRNVLIDEITDSLDELPDAQRQVFVWHVVEGRSFKEISEMTGESINTLLSRKRYAVQFLRTRLQEIHEIMNQIQ